MNPNADILASHQSHWLAPTILTVVGLLLVPSLLKRKRRIQSNVPWPKVPGALPIVGNPLGGSGIENLVAKLEEWASEYGKERGVYEISLYGVRVIVVCGVETLTQVTSMRPYKMRRFKQLNEALNSVGACGLFSGEGGTWKADRRLVAPIMNKKNIKDYLPTMKRVSARLVEKWRMEAEEGDGVVVINEDLVHFAIDVIAQVAFGADFDSLRQDSCSMASDILAMFKSMNIRALIPFPFWKIPLIGQYLDGNGFALRRLHKSIESLVNDFEATPGNYDDPRSKTFLGKLVHLRKQENARMSHQRMIGNLLTVFAGGSDTTHVTICSCLWEIATDETGLQEELAAEALGVDNFDNATMDKLLQALPRLRSLLYEVVRIRGPGPLLGVENAEEISFQGAILQPETRFFMLLRYASTLENSGVRLGPNGERPDKFCARRWLVVDSDNSENMSVLKPSASMGGSMAFSTGFGSGLRICPGRDLSEVEALVCIASLLRAFKISLKDGHPPMKLVTRFTESPNVDVHLKLKLRTD